MRGIRPLFAGLLALSLGLGGRPAYSESKPPQLVRTLEGISEFTLDNGLRVLLFPDSSSPKVTVNITYLVGSRHEGYGETGMAHLLEHLVFKGTPTFPQVPKALQEKGADFNGTTSFDRTNYFETMPASDSNLEFGIKFEADRMVNSFIAKKDLDSEMTVVRNEYEAGENDPSSVLFKRLFATAYTWHNYSNLPIGAKSDIENVPIDRLQAFYRNYYQPDNALLVVAGRFDESKAKEYIQKYFGAIPKPQRVLVSPYTEEPAQDGERLVTLKRVGDTQVIGAIYHIPQGAHPDAAALQILEHVLTNAPSGRLYEALVKTQKATSVSGGSFLMHDPGVFYFSIEVPKQNNLDEVKQIFDQVIQEVIAKGITPEELTRAQTSFDKENTDLFNSSQGLAVQLSEWAAMGDWRLFFVNRERLGKVTPDQAQQVAQSYFRSTNRTLGIYTPTDQPERVEIPKIAEVNTIADSYVPKKAVTAGENFELTAANLLARSEKFTLPGGLQVTYVPKKTRGETVVARIDLTLGTPATLKDQKFLNSYVTAMLSRGTTTLTRKELKDKLDTLKAEVAVSGGIGRTSVTIRTSRTNFAEVLALVGTMLRNPAFDSKEFSQLQQQSITALEEQRTNPQTQVFDAMNGRVYQPDSLFYTGSLATRIAQAKSLNLAALKAFHQKFYGATLGEVSIVGDFDPVVTTPVLTQALGNWQAKTPASYFAPTLQDLTLGAASEDVIPLADKTNAWFLAALPLKITEEDPQYTALETGAYILGGGSLSSRLADRIRQKDGLSYGVGSVLRTTTGGAFSLLVNYAISNPQNIGKVEQAFKEELTTLLTKGITPEELKRATTAMIQEQWVELANDNILAAASNDLVLRQKTFQELADREARLQALTIDQVNKALQTYLDPTQVVLAKAGDFTK